MHRDVNRTFRLAHSNGHALQPARDPGVTREVYRVALALDLVFETEITCGSCRFASKWRLPWCEGKRSLAATSDRCFRARTREMG